jgi:hypothetical protein
MCEQVGEVQVGSEGAHRDHGREANPAGEAALLVPTKGNAPAQGQGV